MPGFCFTCLKKVLHNGRCYNQHAPGRQPATFLLGGVFSSFPLFRITKKTNEIGGFVCLLPVSPEGGSAYAGYLNMHSHTAIYGDDLAGDIPGLGRAEESDSRGYLFGGTEEAQGSDIEHSFFLLLGQDRGQFGWDEAGGNCIGGD